MLFVSAAALACELPSACSPEKAPVVGLLTPYPFSSKPFDFQDCSLKISAEGVIGICLVAA
jgi:hypothetical protein